MGRVINISVAILAALLCCGTANAQANVVQKVITDATATTQTDPVTNQGQTQHLLYATYVDNGGTCVAQNKLAYIRLQAAFATTSGSPDKFFDITSNPAKQVPIQNTVSDYYVVSTASGLYPFVRVLLSNVSPNCKVNAWYSGSSVAYTFPQTLPSTTAGYSYHTLTDTSVTHYFFPFQDFGWAIYGMVLSNNSASNPLTVALNEYGDLGCTSTFVRTWTTIVIPASTTVVLPSSMVPYAASTVDGTNLCAIVTGTTPSYSFSATYRYESTN